MRRNSKVFLRIFSVAILIGGAVGVFLLRNEKFGRESVRTMLGKMRDVAAGTTRPTSDRQANVGKKTSDDDKKHEFDLGSFQFDGNVFTPRKNPESGADSSSMFFLANGDLYDLYGGGREFVQDKSGNSDGRDNRVWVDARVPLEISQRLKLYGVSTLTFGETGSANTLKDYQRNYGVGGGFGISYQLSPSAELNFDFRRTRSLETQSEDALTTDSAGISLKLLF